MALEPCEIFSRLKTHNFLSYPDDDILAYTGNILTLHVLSVWQRKLTFAGHSFLEQDGTCSLISPENRLDQLLGYIKAGLGTYAGSLECQAAFEDSIVNF
jgi:hypothetical protein